MATPWTEPVHALIERTPTTPAGLWSLMSTAVVASASLALVAGTDDDLSLSTTITYLREAITELECACPQLRLSGTVEDVGDAVPHDTEGCRSAITALIGAAHHLALKLTDTPADSTVPPQRRARIGHLLAHAMGSARGFDHD